MSLGTGALAPSRCDANDCVDCGPRKAYKVGLAIAYSKPERMVTLTQVGDDWQTARNRVKRLRHRITSDGYAFEWAWHIEPNPRGTGHHLHAWTRGDYLPVKRLRSLAIREGFGPWVHMKRLTHRDGAARYGLKLMATHYGLKLMDGDSSQVRYLKANGNRLVHASRGYWTGPGLWATAKQAGVQVRGPPDLGPWISFQLVRAGSKTD